MQQVIKIVDNGAKSMRVLEALTPINGTTAPSINASYLGQLYINTTPAVPAIYIAVAVGSVDKTKDWKQIQFVA